MIEAVGEEFWPAYFSRSTGCSRRAGGSGCRPSRCRRPLLATRDTYTWIHKYVFPGGMIPSPEAIDAQLAAHTRLAVVQRRELGPDYATTLRLWRERFLASWQDTRALGFDETFRRMWELYLAYCEAGFRAGYLGVQQLAIADCAR